MMTHSSKIHHFYLLGHLAYKDSLYSSNLPEALIIIIIIIMIIMIILNYQCFDTEFCLIASEKTIYNNLTRISEIIIFEQCGSKIKNNPV